MELLRELWPDEDRRDAALERLFYEVVAETRTGPDDLKGRSHLRGYELRMLEALTHGLDCEEAAEMLGYSPDTVRSCVRDARRIMGCKSTTHACCEAIRQGLIT